MLATKPVSRSESANLRFEAEWQLGQMAVGDLIARFTL
jgi:hypothetical protein